MLCTKPRIKPSSSIGQKNICLVIDLNLSKTNIIQHVILLILGIVLFIKALFLWRGAENQTWLKPREGEWRGRTRACRSRLPVACCVAPAGVGAAHSTAAACLTRRTCHFTRAQVLGLYRECLRVARTKSPDMRADIRRIAGQEFRENKAVAKSDIE